MILISHHGLALSEASFGGVKDAGYGSEAIEAYPNVKFVSQAEL
jgi:hypothetical protein